MLRKLCVVMMVICLILPTLSAAAQDAPSGRWWRSPRVIKALNLTDGELQRLEKAYRQSRRALASWPEPRRDSRPKAREEIRTLDRRFTKAVLYH